MADYQLIIFDWEGTLNDSEGFLLHQIEIAAERLALPPPRMDTAPVEAHASLLALIQALYPGESAQKMQIMLDWVKQSYAGAKTHCQLFPGVKHLLTSLQKRHIFSAIATNMGRSALDLALESLKLSALFDFSATPSECAAKPAPDMLQAIVSKAGCDEANALMIGDSLSDADAAEAAGISFIGVHNPSFDRRSGVMASFSSFNELTEWILPKLRQ